MVVLILVLCSPNVPLGIELNLLLSQCRPQQWLGKLSNRGTVLGVDIGGIGFAAGRSLGCVASATSLPINLVYQATPQLQLTLPTNSDHFWALRKAHGVSLRGQNHQRGWLSYSSRGGRGGRSWRFTPDEYDGTHNDNRNQKRRAPKMKDCQSMEELARWHMIN